MCRFVVYLGKKPLILNEVLDKPENSLINQSRQAREGKLGLNADGFGIGWYEHVIDVEPGLFKSIQPAWNDRNLRHIAAKIQSTCFAGHVRASTIGDVDTLNCHPFSYQQFMFVHNGTIRGFDQIKRPLLNLLTSDAYHQIEGQTDSEHFFALLIDILINEYQASDVDGFFNAFKAAIKQINDLQQQFLDEPQLSKINSVLTDGKQMLVARYISDEGQEPLSLYYTLGDYVDLMSENGVMHVESENPSAILIASEPLTDYAKEWQMVPVNHALLIDESLTIKIAPFNEEV